MSSSTAGTASTGIVALRAVDDMPCADYRQFDQEPRIDLARLREIARKLGLVFVAFWRDSGIWSAGWR
jgi:hypothetical protein